MNQIRKPPEIYLSSNLLEKMDLPTLIYPLWLNKWLILLIVSLSLFMGGLYNYIKTPLYSSNVLLQPETHNGSLFGLDKDFSPASLLSSGGGANTDMHAALIKSRYILEPVIERLGLDVMISPIRFPILGNWLSRHYTDLMDKPWWGSSRYAWGGEKIEISQFKIPLAEKNKRFTLIVAENNQYKLYDSNDRFILNGTVGKRESAVLPDEGKLTLLVNKLEARINTEFSITKKTTQHMVDQLANQINIFDVSQELHLANRANILKVNMVSADANYVVKVLNEIAQVAIKKNAEKKSREATQTLLFINQQLPKVKYALDEAETKLSQYLAKEKIIDLNSESKLLLNEMAIIQKNLNTLKINQYSALQKYTKAHPYMIQFGIKEKALNEQYKIFQNKLSQLPARDKTVIGLMRDVRVKSQLYLILLNKIQSLEVTKGGTISDIAILSLAPIPDQPLPSGTSSILLFSLLAGLILGASIIYMRLLWNQKINDPAIIETQFGLPNMAIIPYSDKQMTLLKSNNPKRKLIPFLAKFDPKDLSIEALRSFRTSAQFALIDAKKNIITITGVAPGVGKSFVSANFAYLQSDAGKKILLIDGDIRKGHLKDYFNVGRVAGLTEVICGACTFEEALIKGPNLNFDFLATGTYPPNPSELLMSNKFKELLEQISKHYDLIIIDTAPILAVTDAAVIAQHSGANFLVLASDTHEVREIEMALKRLDTNGVHISGVIFNFSKQQKGLYRNSQIHKYQYQYEYN